MPAVADRYGDAVSRSRFLAVAFYRIINPVQHIRKLQCLLGLVVQAVYSDGIQEYKEELSADVYEVTAPDMSSAGSKT